MPGEAGMCFKSVSCFTVSATVMWAENKNTGY